MVGPTEIVGRSGGVHWSLAVHVTGFEPVHVPLWQVSVCVHALPSLHDVPLAATGFEHTPVLGLQVPAEWHVSLAVQTTAGQQTRVAPRLSAGLWSRPRRNDRDSVGFP